MAQPTCRIGSSWGGELIVPVGGRHVYVCTLVTACWAPSWEPFWVPCLAAFFALCVCVFRVSQSSQSDEDQQ